MAKCEFCGKDVKFGIKVSHSKAGIPTFFNYTGFLFYALQTARKSR